MSPPVRFSIQFCWERATLTYGEKRVSPCTRLMDVFRRSREGMPRSCNPFYLFSFRGAFRRGETNVIFPWSQQKSYRRWWTLSYSFTFSIPLIKSRHLLGQNVFFAWRWVPLNYRLKSLFSRGRGVTVINRILPLSVCFAVFPHYEGGDHGAQRHNSPR